ncbi:MAG: hypothetical protein Q9170_006321 [Blastenia crenularia]
MVNDIALTCRLHPTSLGIDPAEDGEVIVGKDLKVESWRIENVFQPREEESGWLSSGSTIPSRVVKVSPTKGQIRAVVVMEHKNMATGLEWVKDRLENVLIVKTQGYPTWATREFLNLLSTAIKPQPKFLFFADHDYHGCHIFTVLKYGCMKSAWATDLMVCKLLQWALPSTKYVLDFHHSYIYGDWQTRLAKSNRKPSTIELAEQANQK